jgi:hypothetical protein
MADFRENLFGCLALKGAAKDLVCGFFCFFTASYSREGEGSQYFVFGQYPVLKPILEI